MKSLMVLSIYDSLISGKEVNRKTFCEENHISERTFYRYIGNVSAFLRSAKKEQGVSIKENQGVYRLKRSKPPEQTSDAG